MQKILLLVICCISVLLLQMQRKGMQFGRICLVGYQAVFWERPTHLLILLLSRLCIFAKIQSIFSIRTVLLASSISASLLYFSTSTFSRNLRVTIMLVFPRACVVKEHGVYWDGITLTLNCKYFSQGLLRRITQKKNMKQRSSLR